jgi:glycosyltransferase involved in cell wall biosynthesis
VKAEGCIACSHSTANDVSKFFSVINLHQSGNGVRFAEDSTNIRRDKVYDAVYLGRIDPRKGIDTLLEAWTLVVKGLPSSKLLLVGEGSKRYVLEYKAFCKGNGIENNVIFEGFVEDSRVPALMRASKVFVFPSRSEGFGLAVAEAMSCGLPCIISDLPALRENFAGAAILVSPDNPGALATAISNLIADERTRDFLGEVGAAHVQRYSWAITGSIEQTCLKEIIDSATRRHAPTN